MNDDLQAERRPKRLTRRELEVLSMTAQGLTAREIARDLMISPRTVEQHRSNILVKLGVPNQAAAVLRATVDHGPAAWL